MKKFLLFLLPLVVSAQVQNIPNTTFPAVRTLLNSNFSWLNTNKSDITHLHTGVYSPVGHVHIISDITGLNASGVVGMFGTCSSSQFLGGDGLCHTAPVVSVFGRSGIVTAQSNDYAFSQISGTVSAAQLPALAAYTTVSFSATPTFTVTTATAAQVFKLTLTGNVTSSTLTVTAATAGQVVTFILCQDGTGGRTFVAPSNVSGLGTIDATASACSRQDFRYDGTNAVAVSPMYITGGTPGISIPGASSGVTVVQATAAASGTLTLPAATGTLSYTVASGTSAMGTSAIASQACATVVTTTATGTASTDAIEFTPNGSIKAITGYAPLTTGGLTIAAYPTSNAVNFDVCNWSTGSITPGALTLNWRVAR